MSIDKFVHKFIIPFIVTLGVLFFAGMVVGLLNRSVADTLYLKPCIVAGYDDASWSRDKGFYCIRTEYLLVEELETKP